MDRLTDIDLYINSVRAKEQIKFYIDNGFSKEVAIRRGWEEAYEELLETCLKLRDRINYLEKNQLKGGEV